MPCDRLHNHSQFADLIRIVAEAKRIAPALVEKDYWIMHCLYGLQQLGLKFQLKGGTSLSKGHQAIDRFSEDLDIRIEPPPGHDVKIGKHQTSPAQRKTREAFYDWLAVTIKIDGVHEVKRDKEFDSKDFFSGGIRLFYDSIAEPIEGLKDGVLLEAGFDDVSPNSPEDIGSWAYDHAVASKVDIIDNRAKGVACYDPRYTFVEKLQTVSTKFRRQRTTGESPADFMRHYYDIYKLLQRHEVQSFIGTPEYKAHKNRRFPKADNKNIAENEAFVLANPSTWTLYEKAFSQTGALYYKGKPTFREVLAEIGKWTDRL